MYGGIIANIPDAWTVVMQVMRLRHCEKLDQSTDDRRGHDAQKVNLMQLKHERVG